MLKKVRVLLAGLCFIGIALLFLDVSGIFPSRLAFLAKVQIIPAVLTGSILVVATLLAVTFVFGRVYCSTLCPLGVFQDIVARFGKKNRFRFSAARTYLRLAILVIFVGSFLVGLPIIFGTLEPYSAFGRIAAGLFAPVWLAGNNALAHLSEKTGWLMLAHIPIWVKGTSAFVLAAITFAVVSSLAFRGGRTWCNTLCPAGTALGFLSRCSLLRPRIRVSSCNGCGLCERGCKAACIDAKNAAIDASRCVTCFNCVGTCRNDAISYSTNATAEKSERKSDEPDMVRRSLVALVVSGLTLPASVMATEAVATKEEDIPALTRKTRRMNGVPVIPPGAWGVRSYSAKCTGCQLCVSACPNQVLSSRDIGLGTLQPTLTFERGYCRVNCIECSNICPTGAIRATTIEEKSSIQIGRAVIDRTLCIRNSETVECTTCIRNCPAGVINAIEKTDGSKDIAVDEERCIGCGACEYFCPVRPVGAITVTGNVEHRRI